MAGVPGLLRWNGWIGWPLLWFAVVGSLGQLLAPQDLYSNPERPKFLGQLPVGGSPQNFIKPFDLDEIVGWNSVDGAGTRAQRVQQGFWRLLRKNTATEREQGEFLLERWYTLEAGKTYTQSFYLRHGGSNVNIQITFFTKRGHHPVPTNVKLAAPGIWRVWGNYMAQEGDQAVRAIDFLNLGGNWTYLEVGWAQLEEGGVPTPYRPGRIEQPGLWQRVSWWIGTALIAGLVLFGSLWLLQKVEVGWVALALLVGLGLHLGYAMYQIFNPPEWTSARVGGLTTHPNIFGHMAVATAGLVWLLGRQGVGGLAILLAAGMVWASGSQAAFGGLLLLLLGWIWGLRRWHRVALIGLLILVAGLMVQSGWLGHLAGPVSGVAEPRPQIWTVAWQAFVEHPLGGIGWGQFPLYYKLHLPDNPLEIAALHGHNLILQLLAEAGIFGLLAFLGLWLGLGLKVFKIIPWKAWWLLLMVLWLNLFDYTWFYAGVHYSLWIAVAWVVHRSRMSTPYGY